MDEECTPTHGTKTQGKFTCRLLPITRNLPLNQCILSFPYIVVAENLYGASNNGLENQFILIEGSRGFTSVFPNFSLFTLFMSLTNTHTRKMYILYQMN